MGAKGCLERASTPFYGNRRRMEKVFAMMVVVGSTVAAICFD